MSGVLSADLYVARRNNKLDIFSAMITKFCWYLEDLCPSFAKWGGTSLQCLSGSRVLFSTQFSRKNFHQLSVFTSKHKLRAKTNFLPADIGFCVGYILILIANVLYSQNMDCRTVGTTAEVKLNKLAETQGD